MTSRPYLSLIANHSITICGPPSVLQKLEKSKLAGCRTVQLGLYAPYHAQHLFSAEDIDVVMATTTATAMDWTKYPSRMNLISSATGTTQPRKNYPDLVRSAVEDILINPIVWEDVTQGVAYFSRFANANMVSILAVGTTAASHLRNGLRQRGWATETSDLLGPRGAPSSGPSTSASGKPGIAIVGMSGRFPESDDPEAFWDVILKGLDVHRIVPASRWNAATHVDPTGLRKNTSRTPYGCWLKDPGAFDATFFNITPREAFQVDPASRLALMTAYEAMENAGFVPGTTLSTQKHRVGVAYGVTSNDWMEVNSAQNIDTYFIPGGCRAFIPGRINYVFNLSGPSYSVDTACSSSLSAIQIACNSLWQGDTDTMIAGGTNILTNPDYTAGLDRGHFLSRTGNCKSFDQSADGYCRAEGVCSLILKRLDDAIAENDPVLGVILDVSTNHSAEANSITRPLADAQQQLFRQILNNSNVDASDVSYVEMHGTGTLVGDPIEMESVVSTFAPAKGLGARDANKPLYVGAVKSNVGHGEAAAGVTSLAKVLLMMKHRMIPPHAGLRTTLNEKFPKDMEERHVHVARTRTAWESQGIRRKAFVNNFSAAGGNTALLLEEPPEPAITAGTDPRETHIIAVSAKSGAALQRNVKALLQFLTADSDGSSRWTLPTLSYTTTARRGHHPFRLAVHGKSIHEMEAQLNTAVEKGHGTTRVRKAPSVIFAFTGNGSQYIGMGHQVYKHSPAFRAHLDRLDALVQQQGFPSMVHLCSDATGQTDTVDTVSMHLATICLELALTKLWASWGIKPSYVVGHSLGEYAALAVAGVLSEADAIFLTGRRAQLLQQKCQTGTHAMVSARASLTTVQACLVGRSEIACINGLEDVVLAGPLDETRETLRRLRQQGIKAGFLPEVPYAFHSAQVDPILDELVAACANVTFHKPAIPVFSPLLRAIVQEADTFSAQYLARQCRETVNMSGVLLDTHSSGIINSRSVVVEVGPTPLICKMVQRTLGNAIPVLPSLKKDEDSWSLLAETLSSLYNLGCEIDWKEYHSSFPMSQSVVQLPAYSWDLKNYWIQYQHDWSLRKGDPVPESLQAPVTFTVPSGVHHEAETITQLQNSIIHRVLNDDLDGQGCDITVETDLSCSNIGHLVQGHKVQGVPLVTPSLYAEIALHIGQHIMDKYQPSLKGRIITVDDMTIEHALVAHGGPKSQILTSTVKFDAENRIATCRFETMHSKTQSPRRHSHCKIQFLDRSEALKAVRGTLREAPHGLIASLRKAVITGGAYRFSKNMIYKMVSSLAQFKQEYRQVEEIVLNSVTMEATSIVNFRNLKTEESFYANPAAIDALSQSAGFIMNGNENADLESEVFVNHGWKSFQLFEPLSASKDYVTYCIMQNDAGKSWKGDCIVLHGDTIVAWFGGITLQGVPRRVLAYILGQESVGRPVPVGGKAPANVPEARNSALAKTTPEVEFTLSSEAATSPIGAVTTARLSIDGVLGASATISNGGTGHNGAVRQLLQILSQETGIPEVELGSDRQLAEMGVDSLLMLQLASRLNEEMGIEIGMTDFATIHAVKDLCNIVDTKDSSESVRASDNVWLSESLHIQHDISKSGSQGDIAALKAHRRDTVHVSVTPSAGQTARLDLSIQAFEKQSDRMTTALRILSEETGVRVDALTDDVHFADMGVDSLLSLMILARFREELVFDDVDQFDVPFFIRFRTVGDLQHFIASAATSVTSTEISSVNNTSTTASTECSTLNEIVHPTAAEIPPKIECSRPASSVIIQGRPRVDPYTLFLFPDGSGSATSYTSIGPVRAGIAIVGLNCPYVRHPEDMENVSLDSLIDSYLGEIRRRQPLGPYRLGGWSAGGILAYRAAQVLIRDGEQVDSLVLIDAPPPTGLDPLPERLYQQCTDLGLFGSIPLGSKEAGDTNYGEGKTSLLTTLIPHFRAQIKVLQHYVAEPLPIGLTPRTSIVWAGKSVFGGGPGRPVFQEQPGDLDGIKFITQSRVDKTAGAWGPLFPEDEPSVVVMSGEDHFSMMQPGNANRLAEFISNAAI